MPAHREMVHESWARLARSRRRTALLMAVLGSACHAEATTQPDPSIIERIEATYAISRGYPLHWTTPNDGVIQIDVHTASTTRVFGVLTRIQLVVTVRYEDDPTLRIRCVTDSTDTPESRFRCHGEGAVGGTFWLAPGRGCPASQAFDLDAWFSRACWEGEFAAPSGPLTLHHAFVQRRRREVPVPHFTWSATDGQPILEIDNTRDGGRLDLRTPASAAAPPPALKKQLVLLSLALGYYYVLWRF
jgi:hypothetical protein